MKKWAKGLSALAVGASLVLIAAFLWRSREDLRGVDWLAMLPALGLSLLLYGVSLGAQGWVWIGTVSKLTGIAWNAWDVAAYFQTHLVRRLPGAPWYMASRAILYEARGPDGPASAVAASLFEWIGTFSTAAVWAAGGRWGWGWGLVLVFVLVALASSFPRLSRSSHFPKRLARLGRLSPGRVVCALTVYMLVWVLATFILQLLIRALAPQAGLAWGSLASAWALSAAVSMLTFFAPAGLGVRELTLVAQLAPSTGLAVGTLVALLVRLVFTVGDLFYFGLVSLVRHMIQESPG
ncbi:MAG: hypothetical protein MUF84_06160 [Anaerolineae bacterium]|nr:hypothetical protein [Anaerolineae bacterium]